MRRSLSIDLYGQDIAEVKHREWQEAIKQSKSSKLTTEAIDQVPPPDMKKIELDVKVTHISSPSMFWTHYGEDVEAKEERLQQIIAQNLDRCEGVRDRKLVKVGNVYLAPFKDKDDECKFCNQSL